MYSLGFPQYKQFISPVASCFCYNTKLNKIVSVAETRIAPFLTQSHIPIQSITTCMFDPSCIVFYALQAGASPTLWVDNQQSIIPYPLYFISSTCNTYGMVYNDDYLYIFAVQEDHTLVYKINATSYIWENTYTFPYRIYNPTYSINNTFIGFIQHKNGDKLSLFSIGCFNLLTMSFIHYIKYSYPFEIALPNFVCFYPLDCCFLFKMGDRLYSSSMIFYELSMITPEGKVFIGDFIDLGTIMSESYYKITCYIKNLSNITLNNVTISLPLEKPNSWEAELWDNITLSTSSNSYGSKSIDLGNIIPNGSKVWYISVLTPQRFEYNAKGTYISPLYVSTKRSDI